VSLSSLIADHILTLLTKLSGLCSHWHRSISGIGASAAADVEPSIAPVQIDHSQLLIDGQFVDAASG